MPESDKPRQIVFSAEPGRVEIKAGAATFWLSYHFAPEWFADAKREAAMSTADDRERRSARRREILFAVACAESYLLEWVCHDALSGNGKFRKLPTYFPEGRRWGVTRKWQEIPKQLYQEGVIPAVPDFGGPHGVEWSRLISYRDGLVHANASLPSSPDVQEQPSAVPTVRDLNSIAAGWAVGIVVERITRLHRAVGTPVPEWLTQ